MAEKITTTKSERQFEYDIFSSTVVVNDGVSLANMLEI